MARNKEGAVTHKNGTGLVAKSNKHPRSLAVADKGIKTSHDFANLMSSLMSDLIDGRVAPNVGNATCNAGGKLLRIVELQYKYGTASPNGTSKTLMLTVEESAPTTTPAA